MLSTVAHEFSVPKRTAINLEMGSDHSTTRIPEGKRCFATVERLLGWIREHIRDVACVMWPARTGGALGSGAAPRGLASDDSSFVRARSARLRRSPGSIGAGGVKGGRRPSAGALDAPGYAG
jgi:hypothetical protein